LLLAPAAVLAADEEGCLGCHGLAGFAVRDGGAVRALAVGGEAYGRAMHGELGCRECHTEIASIPHGESKDVTCGLPCHGKSIGGKTYSHEGLYWEFTASAHGRAGGGTVGCLVCHPAPEARENARRDKLEEARRCAACHRGNPKVRAWFQDRHYLALAGGNRRAPSCLDCHSTHRVYPAAVAESTVNPARLADTCASGVLDAGARGGCHAVRGASAVAGATMNQLPRGRGQGPLSRGLALLAGVLCAGLVLRAGVGFVRGR
jgi:hypothetical protein